MRHSTWCNFPLHITLGTQNGFYEDRHSFTARTLEMHAKFQNPLGRLLDNIIIVSLSHMLQRHLMWPVGAYLAKFKEFKI